MSPIDPSELGVVQTLNKGIIVRTAEHIHVSYDLVVCCIIYRVTLVATTCARFQRQFVTTGRQD